jgi:hypothetical protein
MMAASGIVTGIQRRCPACGFGDIRGGGRSGFALAAAVVSLAVIALFIAGSAFFALEEAQTSRNAVAERQAMEAAEYAATAVMRDWDSQQTMTLPIGVTLSPFTYTLGQGAAAHAEVTRATETTFWAMSEGTAGRPSLRTAARRAVNVIYRLAVADPGVRAALTVSDSGEVRNGGVVVGSDSLIAGPQVIAACASPSTPVAGIAAPDTMRICDGGCGSTSGSVRGSPPLLADSMAADPQRYTVLGGRTWQSLTAAADVILPPNAIVTPAAVASAGACQRTAPDNWGEPVPGSPCRWYFPIIWARGDVTVSGGVGQGILLADGDIRFAASASFTGLVVARDDIVILPGGGTILGAALAGDSRRGTGDHTLIESGGLIQFSACGVRSALYGAARLERVRQRAWAEVF